MQRKAKDKPSAHTGRTGRRGRNLPAALCGFVGRLVLVLVILACLPVPLAHLCGYEMYNVISGSMEPAIPVGSAVYVKPVQPAEVQPGDVIAFYSGGSVVTHRVVENDPTQSSFVTKGDANAQPDLNPVRYSELIGRIQYHLPVLGGLLGVYAGGPGRDYLVGLAVAGALLSLLGGLLDRRAAAQSEPSAQAGPTGAVSAAQAGQGEAPGETPAQAGQAAPQSAAAGQGSPSTAELAAAAAAASIARGRRLRRILMGVLAAVLIFSLGAILVIRQRGAAQRQFHADEAQQYTSAAPAQQDGPPITVDFEALCAANSDVAGWLYCEGTGISYPVLQGPTNDTYLRRDTARNYSNAGSIFIEAQNRPAFADSNTVIYGHNMADGSMFAPLSQWQDQAFFDQHPVMWLLTPQQNYKVLLFSAYQTQATSATYTIYTGPCEGMDEYLQMAAAQSAVEAAVPLDGGARYILLSTCGSSYGDSLDRHVLHGMLQPVDSPAG